MTTITRAFKTEREAIEAVGLEFKSANMMLPEVRFVRYTVASSVEWVAVNIYLNDEDLWARCIIEVKL